MRNLKLHSYFNLPIRDITDTMPKGKLYPWPVRDMSQVDHVIVHHMASEAPLMNQALYHINGRGWRGIGYHIVISNGGILQVNDLSHQTNHCSGYNERAIGVSIHGDLSKRELTPRERELLYGVLVTLRAIYTGIQIKGHNECAKTSCPVTSVDRIRADVLSLEEKLDYAESVPAEKVLAFAFASRVADLESKLIHPKFGSEAERKLMMLADVMPQMGYVGDITPQGIAKRVQEIYKNALGKWEREGVRKLLIGANYAKEKGLI